MKGTLVAKVGLYPAILDVPAGTETFNGKGTTGGRRAYLAMWDYYNTGTAFGNVTVNGKLIIGQMIDELVPPATPLVVGFSVSDLDGGSRTYTNAATVGMSVQHLPAPGGAGLTHYIVKDSNAAPAPDDPAWAPLPIPTTYTLPAEGTYTLYAWVKDADGLVSPTRLTSKSNTIVFSTAGAPLNDIVVALDDWGIVYYARSNGDGTFSDAGNLGMDIGDNCRGVALADFDNDGDYDIIAGAGNNTTYAAYYYIEDTGGGHFTNRGVVFYVRELYTWAMDITAGDFNNDGNADVIANANASGLVIYFGNGDGTFAFGDAIYSEGHSRGTDAADFNHDGDLDFARAQYDSGYVYVYLGDGAGHFIRSFVGDTGVDPYGLAAGDFDNDGHADIIANYGDWGDPFLFRGKGDGTFYPGAYVPSLDTDRHGGYDAFDYNRDGKLDVVLANYNGRQMLFCPGTGTGGFGAPVLINGTSNDVFGIAAPPMTAGFGAPVAVVSPRDATVAVGGTVSFSGTSSSDPNGTIVSYEWNFGDGATGIGQSVSHAYTSEGFRRGWLKVTDDTGLIAYAAFTVTVEGADPVAEANGPYTFGEQFLSNGEWTVTLDGTGSSDAETSAPMLKYEWDFGDSFGDDFEDGNDSGWGKQQGTWVEAGGVYTQTNAGADRTHNLLMAGNKLADFTMAADVTFTGGSGQEIQLLFRAQDIYNLYEYIFRGRGYDDVLIYRWIGGSATNIAQRNLPFGLVNNRPYHLEVVCQGTHISAYIDGILAVEVDDDFFRSGLVGLSTYTTTARFDNLVVTSAPGTGKTPTHVYRKGPGTYNVTLKVTDGAGQTDTDTTTVNLVYNDPPVANAGGPYSVTEELAYAGQWPVQLDGSASTDDVEIVDYAWTVEADDFAGTTINSRWLAAGATQDDVMMVSGGSWGTRYLFNRHIVARSQGTSVAVEAKVKLPSSGELMFGFKNLSGDYSYTQMSYALYFYTGNSGIGIYEDSASRGWTGYTFAPNVWYDVRVELKTPAGARYYYRPSGAPDWVLVYDTNYASTHEFLTGLVVTGGVTTVDDYRLVLHGQKPVACYYEPGVYPVSLTVMDRAGQTDTASTTTTVTQGLPPVAEAGPDINLGEAQVIDGEWTVLFNGSYSYDDFDIYRWEWDFGDSSLGSGEYASHTYATPGVYNVTLAVYDHALQSSVDTLVVTIVPGDLPVAEAGPDRALGELDAMSGTWPVQFDGSGSTDDYGIVRYEWDFGDSTTGSGKVVSHTYTAMGVYTVTLVVYDQMTQASAPDTCTVTIAAGAPPVADAGGPYVAIESEVAAGTARLLFDGSASTDDAPMLHYIWDFGTETFLGRYFDKKMWDFSAQVYQQVDDTSDRITIWGPGSWGGRYLFTSYTVKKRPGLFCQARISGAGALMFGFKNGNNTNYSYEQMPYAIHPSSGTVHIYEDGNQRAVTSYRVQDYVYYDYKVVIDDDAGASYYMKRWDETAWTRIYKSTYVSGDQLKPGLTVHSGGWNLNQFRRIAAGKRVTFPVRAPGQVTLTVEDQAHQTNSQTVPITVVGSNDPVANPGGPYFSTYDMPVKFDGSASTDDRGVVKYLWDFGDGTGMGSGPTPIHVYPVGSNTGPTTKTVTLTVFDAGGHSDTRSTTVTLATGPVVVCVPWQFSGGAEVPHRTWSGQPIRLKGTVRGGIGTLSYTWNFGDGTLDATGTVSAKYAIEATHTYTGSDGATFTATLTVKDSLENTHSDTYPIVILPYALDTRSDVAIDEGLWWLHKVQYRSNDYSDGQWTYSGYIGSPTGSALQAFLINGHRETGHDEEDPYVDTVRRGMKRIIVNLQAIGIGNQTYGNPDYPYDGKGNGIGLAAGSDRMPYEGGMIMDGIVASATPNRVAWCGEVYVAGRTYKEILQDMIDCYAWGQSDNSDCGGGWRYGWNEWPDNSACQWAAIGMIPSTDAPWFCVIPQWVRQRNNVWLAYSYDAGNRWFGYTGTGAGNTNSIACRPSGMVQMVMSVDSYKSDSRWTQTEGWFANTGNWNWFIGNRTYYGWYAFVKAMRLSKTEALSNGFNWYRGANGIAEKLLAEQESDGTWPAGGQVTHPGDYGDTFVTAWAIVMLTPSLFALPPVAEAGPDIVWGYDLPLTFDGSGSYHLDPSKTIVLYEWDFEGDGVYDYAGDNPVAVHTFPFDSGVTYPVTYRSVLRVTDNEGMTDTDTRQVVIAEPPHAPFAVITGPRMVEGAGVGTAGLPIMLDGTDSFDIDPGDIITRYEWDFDGSNGYDFDHPQSTDPVTSVTFANPGIYHVGLRVWDNGVMNPPDNAPLASVPAYLVIKVEANRAPVADAGGPYAVDEGSPLELQGSGVDPNLAGDPLTFAWDLDNDGQYDDATGPTPSCTWMANGTYTVSLKVSDGLLSGTDTATVTVNDMGPNAEFVVATDPALEGSPVQFNDASTSPADPIVIYEWDFAGLGTSPDRNPSFNFGDKGVYTVTLTVTDSDGSTDTVSDDVTVLPVGPTANDDTATVQAYSGPNPINVLANDTYLPGPPEVLRIVAKTNGAHGTVVITGGSTGLTYQPAPTYVGPDSFTYTISDEDGLTDTATVNVTVKPAPLPGDVNGDGCVNVADLLYVRNNMGKTHQQAPAADVVGDGDGVNIADLLFVRNKIGTGVCR